jgi:hypothetical protein
VLPRYNGNDAESIYRLYFVVLGATLVPEEGGSGDELSTAHPRWAQANHVD